MMPKPVINGALVPKRSFIQFLLNNLLSHISQIAWNMNHLLSMFGCPLLLAIYSEMAMYCIRNSPSFQVRNIRIRKRSWQHGWLPVPPLKQTIVSR